MIRLILVPTLIAALLGCPTAATAGPLLDAAKLAAKRLPQAPPATPKPVNRKQLWVGLAILGAGAALVAVTNGGDSSCATRVCDDPQGEFGGFLLGLAGVGLGTGMVVAALRGQWPSHRPPAIGYGVRF